MPVDRWIYGRQLHGLQRPKKTYTPIHFGQKQALILGLFAFAKKRGSEKEEEEKGR